MEMGKFDFMPEDRRVPVVSSAFCSHDSSRAERGEHLHTPAIATTHCHVGLFDLAHPLPNAWLTAVLAQQRPCCSRGAARVVRSSGLIPLNILTTTIGFEEGLKLQMQAASGIWSSDPESHPKVGFESVSGFGFRDSSIETDFRCRFRVSGFGFRRLKPTFAVGFGFRVSGFVD